MKMTLSPQRWVQAAIIGGFVAGTLDIGAAALIYLVPPAIILHAIASGVLGPASFHEGAPAAFLGLMLQWAMSLLIAAIYAFAIRRFGVLAHRWTLSGFAYGVVVFFVMNYIVVPLSAARPDHHLPDFTLAMFVENLVAMIVFGLIIAFFSRGQGRAAPTSPQVAKPSAASSP